MDLVLLIRESELIMAMARSGGTMWTVGMTMASMIGFPRKSFCLEDYLGDSLGDNAEAGELGGLVEQQE
jgi:hypothetical protein